MPGLPLFTMKRILFLMTAVLGMAAAAWALNDNKAKDIQSASTIVAQQVWYDVDGSSELPSDLEITSGPASLPKNQPTCNMTNAGLPCGVHLSFPNNDAPSSVPAGTTVQDLIDNYGASIILDGLGDPEFTRKN